MGIERNEMNVMYKEYKRVFLVLGDLISQKELEIILFTSTSRGDSQFQHDFKQAIKNHDTPAYIEDMFDYVDSLLFQVNNLKTGTTHSTEEFHLHSGSKRSVSTFLSARNSKLDTQTLHDATLQKILDKLTQQ